KRSSRGDRRAPTPLHQIGCGRRRIKQGTKSLGVDAKVVQELLRHASFKTTMDGYTQALEPPKRQAQEALADLIMRTGKASYA
ncbi:MAG: hypothetical protein ACXVK3_15945, partial [Candidatus Angelobacter sp.]